MIISITASKAELKELQKMHQRATNTLEPEKWPTWLKHYDEVLTKADGMGPGDISAKGAGADLIMVTLIYPQQ